MIRRRHDGVAMNGSSPIIRKDVGGNCDVGAIAAYPARTVGPVTCVMPPTILEKEIAEGLAVSRAEIETVHSMIGDHAICDDAPVASCRHALPDAPLDVALFDHVRVPTQRKDSGVAFAI